MNRLTRRTVLAVPAMLTAPASAQTTRWDMPTEYPANSMPGEGVATFARLAMAGTGGRLTVAPSFDASAGVRSAQMLDAIRAGRFPAGDSFAGALGGAHPLFLLSSLPFLATTIDDARRLYAAARPGYDAVLNTMGQRVLYGTPWPPTGIWAKTPIRRPEELRGLAIRTYDATGTEVLRAAGAAPTELSFADLMPRLRDGSVNAVLSSGDGGAGRRLWEFLPHFTALTYAQPVSLASVNLAALAALDADLRNAVVNAAAETERHLWTLVRTRLDENYARMRANGVTITSEVTPELRALLDRAAEAAIADWSRRAGPEGATILQRYRGA